MSRLRFIFLLPLVAMLSACNMVVMNPSGDVAVQERDLFLLSTGLMLLIVIPVMILTAWYAWHYRASNTSATYSPDWDHSTSLEFIIWGGPILIIIALATATWIGTYKLNPYDSLHRIAPGQPVPVGTKPLEVEVVALDWKWLFIYPEYGIATVNDLAAPVNRPITFRITSSTYMNSFYIPALAGQILCHARYAHADACGNQ